MPPVRRSGVHAPSHWVFFALACLQAALAVPLWWAEWAGWLRLRPSGMGALVHAHEMLLGFALAVIGGFLFTAIRRPTLALAATAWVAGRVASTVALGGWGEAAAALAFPLILAVLAGLPFLRAARSGHNLVFAPVLLAFLVAESLYQAGRLELIAGGDTRAVWLAFDMVALMVLVMGGRLLPAAMAGIVRLIGGTLAGRNRPRLEQVMVVGMALAAVIHLTGLPADIARAGWLVAGLAALARQSAWRPGLAAGHPALWPLHLGYAWLGAGLVGTALGTWGGWPEAALVHAVTVGGLGIVTATMMVRTVMLRDRVSRPFPRVVLVAVSLLSAAAVMRIASPILPGGAMTAAAVAWASAFALVLWALADLRLRTGRAGGEGEGP